MIDTMQTDDQQPTEEKDYNVADTQLADNPHQIMLANLFSCSGTTGPLMTSVPSTQNVPNTNPSVMRQTGGSKLESLQSNNTKSQHGADDDVLGDLCDDLAQENNTETPSRSLGGNIHLGQQKSGNATVQAVIVKTNPTRMNFQS